MAKKGVLEAIIPHRKWPFYGDISDIPYPLTVTTTIFSGRERAHAGWQPLGLDREEFQDDPKIFLMVHPFFWRENTCQKILEIYPLVNKHRPWQIGLED